MNSEDFFKDLDHHLDFCFPFDSNNKRIVIIEKTIKQSEYIHYVEDVLSDNLDKILEQYLYTQIERDYNNLIKLMWNDGKQENP